MSDSTRRIYGRKLAWLCEASFDYEIEGDIHGTTLYPSPHALQEAKKCCALGECNMVEVEIRVVDTIMGSDTVDKRLQELQAATHAAKDKP